MTALNEKKFEEQRRRLENAAGAGTIFGRGSGKTWNEAYRLSYLAGENGALRPEPDQVRRQVRVSLAREFSLISPGEEQLLQRMMIFGGGTPLFQGEELAPALSLVRRLWCWMEEAPNGPILVLSPQIGPRMVELARRPRHQELRRKVYEMSAQLHALLYMNGFFYAQGYLRHFLRENLRGNEARSLLLLMRYLQAEYDYILNDQGEMILLHPGLSDARAALENTPKGKPGDVKTDYGGVLEKIWAVYAAEAPAVRALTAALSGALQAEYDPETTVGDLKLLVKQGVSGEELARVLKSRMAVAVTPAVRSALSRLETETIPWGGLRKGRLN